MTTYQDLRARLERGEVIIMDGATGTELQSRAVPMHYFAWSAAAIDTHPETIREVHEDFIRAGADVIIATTFSTARHVLEPAGLGDRVRALNERAVALTREARDNAAAGPGDRRPALVRRDRRLRPLRQVGRPGVGVRRLGVSRRLPARRAAVGRDGRAAHRRLLRQRAGVHPAARGASVVDTTPSSSASRCGKVWPVLDAPGVMESGLARRSADRA
jgi:hypothetical protein